MSETDESSSLVPTGRRELTGFAPARSLVSRGIADVAKLRFPQTPYELKLDHSLCRPYTDQSTGRTFLQPIIKRGTNIPCSFTETYHASTDPANRVVISIIVGDDYENAASSQNIKLAEIPWEFHPPRRQRDSAIEVTYEYDTERIFTLQIHDIYTGQKRRFAIQQVSQN